jgi:hypothetical protein
VTIGLRARVPLHVTFAPVRGRRSTVPAAGAETRSGLAFELLGEGFDAIVPCPKLLNENCARFYENRVEPKELFMPVRLFQAMEVVGKQVCRTRPRDSFVILAAGKPA